MAQPKIAVSNEFRIVKGIQIPKTNSKGLGLNSKYPFRSMERGDSFFAVARHSSVIGAAKYFCQKHCPEWRFVARTVTEDGVKGVRIWRIA